MEELIESEWSFFLEKERCSSTALLALYTTIYQQLDKDINGLEVIAEFLYLNPDLYLNLDESVKLYNTLCLNDTLQAQLAPGIEYDQELAILHEYEMDSQESDKLKYDQELEKVDQCETRVLRIESVLQAKQSVPVFLLVLIIYLMFEYATSVFKNWKVMENEGLRETVMEFSSCLDS